MPSTPIRGPPSWIRATRTSRLAFSSFAPAAPMAVHLRLLLNLPICIPPPTRQVPPALLNGEGLRNSNRLGPLLPRKPLARAGLAGFPTSTRRLSRPTPTRAGASLSVVAARRRLSDSPALPRRSRLVSRIPSSTGLVHRVVARRRRCPLISMPSLRRRRRPSLKLRPPLRLSDALSIPIGVVRRLPLRHLLPTIQTVPTRLRTE